MALVAVLAFSIPADAQQHFGDYSTITDRAEDLIVLIEDPDGGGVDLSGNPIPTYRRIKVSDLLDGLVDFPDMLTRYVVLKAPLADMPTTPPMFSGADVAGGSVSTGSLVGVAPPATTVTGQVWVAVAVPHDTRLPYVSLSSALNTGDNSAGFFSLQAGGPVTAMVGSETVEVDVWVFSAGTHQVFLLPFVRVYFSPDAPTAP